MNDDKEYDDINQIGKNDENALTDYIKVLKLGILISKKKYILYWKKSDEKNWMNIIEEKDSNERY